MTNRRRTKRRKRAYRRRRRTSPARRIAMILAAVALVVLVLAYAFTRLQDEAPYIDPYPMEYTELIRSRAAAEGLDPAYVAAVILAESGYDPQARSHADAQGLMQILPSTGEWIAGKFDESYAEGCLYQPETNVRYGCWYLGFLMRRYDGDMRLSSAAYHAGQGTVDKWLADPAYSSDGKTLEVIAYDTTSTYVDRVLKYYEKYEELYAELELQEAA